MSREKIIVFLKAPRPGFVKTRIAVSKGSEEACRIYTEILSAVLKGVESFAQVELRFTPDDAEGEIAALAKPGWVLRPQGDGDLGVRLQRAFTEALAEHERVVVIGTDSPEISARDIKEAFRVLKQKDLVVGPACDGGYWLIGMKKLAPALFANISWGTSEVLGQTLAAAKKENLGVDLLQILWDIDTAQDYQEWLKRRG